MVQAATTAAGKVVAVNGFEMYYETSGQGRRKRHKVEALIYYKYFEKDA